MLLRLGNSVPCTTAEGPGNRYALWVQGCLLRCPACCNKELWDTAGGTLVETKTIIDQILSTNNIEGVTFLGGEPLLQAKALSEIAREIKTKKLSIIVFSGYTLDELRNKRDKDIDNLLSLCDVLVDGRYEPNTPSKYRWVGSGNQKIHFFTNRYSENDFIGENTLEIRFDGKTLTVNGWPKPW